MDSFFDVLYRTPRKSFDSSYYCPVRLSENKERDKALHARPYVRYMPATCEKCNQAYNPNVNFPLVFSVRKCLKCDPWQRLIRYPPHLIPDWFNEAMFRDEMRMLLKKSRGYPTCTELFNNLNERIRKMEEREDRRLHTIHEEVVAERR